MIPKRPSTKQLRALYAEVHPDDGIDPREWQKLGRDGARKTDRKARQLCGQVAEALGAVLAGDCDDDVLRDLQVVDVIPAPDISRLLVTVRADLPVEELDPGRVLQHLAHASGRLRSEVATAITRRRVPVLAYRVAVPV